MRWLLYALAAVVLSWAARADAADGGSLNVTSTAFADGAAIPSQYTCQGSGVSPPIFWSAVPPDAQSIAVIVDDPDAPGGTFEHLALFDLPPSEPSLPSLGASPAGTEGTVARNSSGGVGFAPICPPSGQHRYRFQVLALDKTIALPNGVSSAAVSRAMSGHVLARGLLTGVYQKSAAK